MPTRRAIVPTLIIGVLSVASVAFGQTPASSENSESCAGISIDDVGPDLRNPFAAQRVSTSVTRSADGKEHTTQLFESLARDSAGRIRIEKSGSFKPGTQSQQVELSTRDGGKIVTTEALLQTVVLIFEFPDCKVTQLLPGMRIARTIQHPIPRHVEPRKRPYSSLFMSGLGRNTPPVRFDDLGYKEIEGIPAHGVKTTHLGNENGALSGQPIKSFEIWASDDLAAVLLRVVTDLKKGSDGTTRLVDIKREEPDPSLFQIPAGYTVNPTPEQMPFRAAQSPH